MNSKDLNIVAVTDPDRAIVSGVYLEKTRATATTGKVLIQTEIEGPDEPVIVEGLVCKVATKWKAKSILVEQCHKEDRVVLSADGQTIAGMPVEGPYPDPTLALDREKGTAATINLGNLKLLVDTLVKIEGKDVNVDVDVLSKGVPVMFTTRKTKALVMPLVDSK